MKRVFFVAAAVLLVSLWTVGAYAEDADKHVVEVEAAGGEISMADVPPTPEMWFYVQERRRYEDPRAAIRRKAEYRAQQRQQRIAAMKAFGESKQRPRVENSVFYSMFTTRNDHGWPAIWPTRVIEIYEQAAAARDSHSP